MLEKFISGLVGAPFGLDGFVKIKPLSGEIEHLLKLKSVTIRQAGKEQILQIEEVNACGETVLMRFAGINSPEKAKTLNGAELLLDRSQAAPLGCNEFYIEDLKGLAVLTVDNEVLGNITDVLEGGGGDLVEIKLNNGKKRLVPFRQDFFSGINPEKGNVTLNNLWILE